MTMTHWLPIAWIAALVLCAAFPEPPPLPEVAVDRFLVGTSRGSRVFPPSTPPPDPGRDRLGRERRCGDDTVRVVRITVDGIAEHFSSLDSWQSQEIRPAPALPVFGGEIIDNVGSRHTRPTWAAASSW